MAIATRTAPATKTAAKPAATPATKANGSAGAAVMAQTAKEAKLTVTKTVLEGATVKGEEVLAEEIEVKSFATTPASTYVSFSVTKNLGNYESAKVTVGISMPHYVEEAESALEQVTSKVKEALDKTIEELGLENYASAAAADGTTDLAAGEGEADTGTEEGEAEGGDLTPEWVQEASREELEALISENSIEIDPTDFADDDELKQVLIASLWPEEEGTEGTDGATTEEVQPYTEDDLKAASMDELSEVWKAWEMGKFPAYTKATEKAVKASVIKKILAKQEEGA